MVDVRKTLAAKYKLAHRFKNFGPVITSSDVEGFRGVKAKLSFEYPITALTGFNGSGKSTIGQLMLCGYKKLSTSTTRKRFYVKDFFPSSAADPEPFIRDAAVTFRYQTDKPEQPQELTISRAQKEWSGYKRQPERNTEYVGFTVYIPKVERRDLSIYGAANLELTSRNEIEDAARRVSRILGSNYDDIYFQGVSLKKREGELGIACRLGATYSENNMGFGEGRLIYTVRLLETCPEQSLIVLEEPETSLHENAQYEFVKYLMDVVDRRHHQIIFSTHSSVMMDALPPEGRKLLIRDQDGVKVFDNVSSSRIRTALSAGERGHFVICVEDKFAQSMLREILMRFDRQLIESVEVLPFGDNRAVVSAQKAIIHSGQKAISVLDADQTANESQGIYCLPGSLPPEKEVFHSKSAEKTLRENYGFDFPTFRTSFPDHDHHQYASHIAEKKSCSREVLESDCIRAFLDEVGATWYDSLCKKIRTAIS
ncbi:ATP-binding protein [Roseomonas sp. M0104]|uniref:ATP-binding protein n=1 Tax=Teichococcus coralli TaxID=2545983 RepID=A0A845BCJ1_9PROT|nr:AAA family ATPase [Pseudoroseomonas coralli]MXP64418.1 ATP-binding protein [Pseudoroseomonas coralli]